MDAQGKSLAYVIAFGAYKDTGGVKPGTRKYLVEALGVKWLALFNDSRKIAGNDAPVDAL